MTNHQLINQTSNNTEYWTPSSIIEAARDTMGVIDLDPASSELANERVLAHQYFTKEDDGLKQKWFGNVWMNHPFGRVENPLWIEKLEYEFGLGAVQEACCLTYACTSEAWFRPLLLRPQVYLQPRTNFILPDGNTKRGVTKGSVVTYYGSNYRKFFECFKGLGVSKL